jgi:hypothetical protein
VLDNVGDEAVRGSKGNDRTKAPRVVV